MPQHLPQSCRWHLRVCAEQEVRADVPASAAGRCPREEGLHVGPHRRHSRVTLHFHLAMPRLQGVFPVPGGNTEPLFLVSCRD